ncbi:mandelate racemase/muconate lactonizing enzyme family protein [Gimesia aquarii]|uniref:mandelate racemase/muconate lactonizing enzyme family protein n=1 Tax=Gimesia aquarii TaxID=2527964 RepID=UPI001E294728|nr:mandelate racemase/muconate lactonizing enzyme family protein [Gimesia aquarii]
MHAQNQSMTMFTTNRISRRKFLATSLAGVAGSGILTTIFHSVQAAEKRVAKKHLQIERIERTTVKVPFREVPARNMARELPHWAYTEIIEVHLKSGHVGFGETLLYYTWNATSDEAVQQAQGKNAAELMWDDELGAGLQMALFDAVAKAAEVPVHALLGKKINEQTPLSWWNIDTSVKDMALECAEAYKQGYMSYKTKGRPWFDVWAQVEEASKVVPANFKIDMDFNDTLLDAKRAIPILKDLAEFPQVDIFESPIFQTDIAGNKKLMAATDVNIAMHYGIPSPLIAIRENICDGFVIGHGASELMAAGAVAAMANKPFWLQLVGTGITAAFSLHFGGVLSHATWPAVNCHQLYKHNLLTEPIVVKDGFAKVPDKPGLGYELDRDLIEKLRVKKPSARPDPPRLIETTWKDGRKMYFGNTGEVNFVLTAGQEGKVPFFERGVDTRLVPNDGSKEWKELYSKASQQPFLIKG